ncbi:MAG: TRAM domain-containing protein, partial [Acidobacteria bacterium]|nr:TRAM domain-containing protein [Acidobacteriota bacterium]
MLVSGSKVSVDIEKPAAGGRMIARHEGQILLVAGAIPGERVTVTIDRVEKRLAFASTVSVDGPSADRREAHDPLCGGCVYAHIAYPRQIALKAEIIADAFVRIGKIPLADTVTVQPSPESGYRLRARLHVRGNDAGFYREGTHAL